MSSSSSPISINEATTEGLCTLPQIGEKRAARILRYRADVGPIRSADDLANAAGISLAQAETIANEVDWGQTPTGPTGKPWLALATLAVTATVVGVSFLGTELDGTSASATLYNASITLMLAGCAFGAADILIARESHLAAALHMATLVLVTCGAFLFAALVLKVSLQDGDDRLAVQVVRSWKFASFALIVVALQLGPGIVMRVAASHSRQLARLFDLAQLPLAAAIYMLVPLGAEDSLMEEIFFLWAGMMFVFNGWGIAKGSSSFALTLSDRDRSEIAFIQREAKENRGLLYRCYGVCLTATGTLLAVSAVVDGWVRLP